MGRKNKPGETAPEQVLERMKEERRGDFYKLLNRAEVSPAQEQEYFYLSKLSEEEREEIQKLYADISEINEEGEEIENPEKRAAYQKLLNAALKKAKRSYWAEIEGNTEKIKAAALSYLNGLNYSVFAWNRLVTGMLYIMERDFPAEIGAATRDEEVTKRLKKKYEDIDTQAAETIDAGLTEYRQAYINASGKDALIAVKEWYAFIDKHIEKKTKEWVKRAEADAEKAKAAARKTKREIIERKPELQAHPVKLKVPTSLLFQKLKEINSEFLKKDRATGQTFMLVTDYFYPLDVAKDKKRGVPITSYAALRSVTGEELPERLRKLGEFDIDVLSAVGTLNLLGNMTITPEQIHATMTGAEASTKQAKADNIRLRTPMRDKILLSLEKWRARILYLDFSNEIENNLIDAKGKSKEDKEIIASKHFELTMLSYDLGTYKTKSGTEGTEIKVHTLPVVYRYSGWKNQITDIENNILAAPYKKDEEPGEAKEGNISATEDNIALTHYLARRIEVMKTKQETAEAAERGKARRENRKPKTNTDLLKPGDRSILFETIFKECDITINNAVMKKKRIATIEKILTSWKNEGNIADYKIISEGKTHVYTKVLIGLKDQF